MAGAFLEVHVTARPLNAVIIPARYEAIAGQRPSVQVRRRRARGTTAPVRSRAAQARRLTEPKLPAWLPLSRFYLPAPPLGVRAALLTFHPLFPLRLLPFAERR